MTAEEISTDHPHLVAEDVYARRDVALNRLSPRAECYALAPVTCPAASRISSQAIATCRSSVCAWPIDMRSTKSSPSFVWVR
ncbi:MAG: hypothetical protein GY719_28400 [bacterium]|nr:hypothetical protein [bacterium]